MQKTGGRLDKGLRSSRFDAKTTGGQETTSGRAERAEGEGRKGSDHFQRVSRKEERQIKRNGLTCLYINARNIVSKMEYLEAWSYESDPDIIGVSESWAADDIPDSFLELDGYDMFRQDRPVDRGGGGVLLYVKSVYKAVYHKLVTAFPEQVWCYILDSYGNRLYIGVCYRTPTASIFGSGNHDLLRIMLNELGSSKRHFVLMGDCNYRYKQWPLINDGHLTDDAKRLSDCIDDNFFTQHVQIPTREDVILDLVITDEPNMVSNLETLGLFHGSDHCALLWTLEVGTSHTSQSRPTWDYSKADTAAMKKELFETKWQEVFEGYSTQQCWWIFKDKLELLQRQHVPVKYRSTSVKRKPVWMTHKALKAVKKRHQVFKKYKDASHPACIKADKQSKKLMTSARRQFEDKLVLL
jgi:Endonuclease-reverse transcriptase